MTLGNDQVLTILLQSMRGTNNGVEKERNRFCFRLFSVDLIYLGRRYLVELVGYNTELGLFLLLVFFCCIIFSPF
jgi:hypothetical protein